MVQPVRKYYSVEEYLALEDAAEYKSEYYRGEIFAMVGGSYNHNVICLNAASAINQAFTDRPGVTFTSDMKVKVSAKNFYTYPDVSAVCGEPAFEGSRTDIITNPALIIEVLSDSTSRYDRGGKFELYRALPGLQDYLLLDQSSPLAEYYHCLNESEWLLKTCSRLEDTITLQAVGVELSLRQLYNKVIFPS